MKLEKKDIEQFLMDRPRSISYRKLCRHLLWPFKKWLGDRDLMPELVKQHAREKYKNPKSHNTFLAVMKSFADWKMKRLPQDDVKAFIRDRQTLELIKDIRRDRVVVRLEKKELSVDELKMIFGSLEGVKFSGIWSLGWFGCRPGELVELDLPAINKDPDTYLPESLVKEMRPGDYCLKFLTEKTVVERAVFMDGFTKGHLERFIKSGLGYKSLYDTCVELQDKVGVKFTPKWFRSTFQTKMQRALMESGVPTVKLDLLVKVMSGHTVGPDITSVYTDYGSDIKKAMTELHYMIPIEKKLGKKGLTLEELERVLGKYSVDSLKFSVIWLLFWFGVGPRELVAPKDRIIDFKVGKVVFEERELYFDPFTTEHLERFLNEKPSTPSTPFVYKVCKEAGIEPKAGRQTFISHMPDITDDIERAFRESHYMIPLEGKFYTYSSPTT